MSFIEQINNLTSEEIIIRLIEEHIFDEETSLVWGEETDIFERNDNINISAASDRVLKQVQLS